MTLTLDGSDPSLPPYARIVSAVAAQVEGGSLAPGDRLPTVRALADQLGVAVNTVAKAYRELEQSGAIETRGRSGSFITGDEVESHAKAAATAYLERTRALGLADAEAVALVRDLTR